MICTVLHAHNQSMYFHIFTISKTMAFCDSKASNFISISLVLPLIMAPRNLYPQRVLTSLFFCDVNVNFLID